MLNTLKFRDFTFVKRCNNAEYSSVATRFVSRVTATGLETLNVPEEYFTLYQARKAVLTNLISMSRISDETSKINEVEAKIANLLKFIHSVIGSARNTPIAAKQEAGTILYNTTHSYLYTHKLPQQQMLETVNGMLTDLSSSKLEVHIKTLNLETEVETLTLLHAQLTVLLDSRAEVQMVISEENSKIVRQDMDELFEMMMAIIWAYSLTNPSEEIKSFIKSINKVLFDTETAYNQRIAQRGKKEEEEEDSTDVEDNTSTEEVPSEEQGAANDEQ